MTLDSASSNAPEAQHAGPSALRVGDLLTADELDGELLARWRGLLDAQPTLDRPFFTPDYVTAVAGWLDGVRVAVLEEAGSPVGFLPLRLLGRGAAGPPGGRLDDFQGPILDPRVPCDLTRLLPAVGVRAWRSNHRLERGSHDRAAATERFSSPVADLSGGFDAYEAAHRTRKANWTKQVPRKRRGLEREHGTVRFELEDRSDGMLELMRAWKHRQRVSSGTTDPLNDPRLWGVVRTLAERNTGDVRGVLSVLRAGDRPVALHFGLRTARTLHYWFPTYDGAFESASPGAQLLVDLLRGAGAEGVTRVDLGRGSERYKRSFANDEAWVLEEHFDRRPILGRWTAARESARRWARSSAAGQRIKGALRAARRRASGG